MYINCCGFQLCHTNIHTQYVCRFANTYTHAHICVSKNKQFYEFCFLKSAKTTVAFLLLLVSFVFCVRQQNVAYINQIKCREPNKHKQLRKRLHTHTHTHTQIVLKLSRLGSHLPHQLFANWAAAAASSSVVAATATRLRRRRRRRG